MSNVLEYILKLTDRMSPAMRQAASVADSSAAKIQAQMNRATGSTRNFTYSLSQLKERLDRINATRMNTHIPEVFRTATREAQRLERQIERLESRGRASGGVSGGLNMKSLIKGNIISQAIMDAPRMIGGAFANVVGTAMDMGKAQKSFEVLTGSKSVGQGLVKDINKMVVDSIMGPELFSNAQMMLSFGVAVDSIMPSLKMLGDVSMGDKDKMERLTLAFSQVQAAGKLMGQDLLQFINAGFNPLQEISAKTGVSMAELRKQMENGAITSQMVVEAFQSATGAGGKFHNMLEQIANTPAGKLAQLEGQFSAFKARLGEALMPLAEFGLQLLNRLLDIANVAIPYIQSGVQFILGVISGINVDTASWSSYLDTIQSLFQSYWNTLKHVASVVWKILGGLLDWISKSELLKDVFWLIGQVFEGVYYWIGKATDAIEWLWDYVLKPVLNGLEFVYQFLKNPTTTTLELFFNRKKEAGGNDLSDKKNIQDVPDQFSFAGMPPGVKTSNPTTPIGLGDKAASINSGGQRSIIINIGKQIEKLELHTVNMRQGADEMGQIIREELLRVLNSANAVAVN